MQRDVTFWRKREKPDANNKASHFARRLRKIPFDIVTSPTRQGIRIENSDSLRYLGVIMNKNQPFNHSYQDLSEKLS